MLSLYLAWIQGKCYFNEVLVDVEVFSNGSCINIYYRVYREFYKREIGNYGKLEINLM